MGFTPVLSNISLGLPLLIVVVAGALWWWTTRATPPPFLVATPPYHSWRVNPVAAAYDSLRQDRYLLAAFLLRERLANRAEERFGVSPEDFRSWAAHSEEARLSAPVSVRRVLNDLTAAYRSAYLSEGMRPAEAFSTFTVPMRRRRAARDFDRAASEVEQVLAAWGTPA